MIDSYYIYNLRIESKYHFIYCHIDDNKKEDDPNTIIKTCKMLYPFLQKYNDIRVSIITDIRSFNYLNQERHFVNDNLTTCYHMKELRNKLFTKELYYIDFYVKQYMIDFGIDNVRGGSYISDFNIDMNYSVQDGIMYPLHILNSNKILQETNTAIKELDNKFLSNLDKNEYIEQKLMNYLSIIDEIEMYYFVDDKCIEKIILLESLLIPDNEKKIEMLMIQINADIVSRDYQEPPKYIPNMTNEQLLLNCNIYRELYYNKKNHLDNLQFTLDNESVYTNEVCKMLLCYYSS